MKKAVMSILLFLGLVNVVNLTAMQNCYQITSHENRGFYVGINSGPNWLDSSSASEAKTERNVGFLCGGVLGYKSSPFYSSSTCTFSPRLEAEALYRYHRKNNSAHSLMYMTNFLIDADFGMPLNPYLGFGLGFGHNWGKGNRKTHFAYQGIAGFSYSICEKIDLTIEYRCIKLGKKETNHAAVFGIKKYF